MRSKRDTHNEALINSVLGILIGLIVMRILLPLIKDLSPELQSVIVVFTMFGFSYSRSYLVGRFYNWWRMR